MFVGYWCHDVLWGPRGQALTPWTVPGPDEVAEAHQLGNIRLEVGGRQGGQWVSWDLNKPALCNPNILGTIQWPRPLCIAQLGFLSGNISSGLVAGGDLGWYLQRGLDDSGVIHRM